MSITSLRCRRIGRVAAGVAAVALTTLAGPWSLPVQAQQGTAATPNVTQTANINAALAQLRADIAETTRINQGVRSRTTRERNAREIARLQRVLDNLTGKLRDGELHPVNGLDSGTVPGAAAGTTDAVRFVFEDENARTLGMDSTPTGAYCPDNAYILIGTPANLQAYQNITGRDAAAARAARTQFVNSGRVRRLPCPRGDMIFDSGLLDPGNGTAINVNTTDGWCQARELLDVLVHEKYHEIIIEDAVAALRQRRDFQSQPANAQAVRERAVFRNGASHSNHRVVYNGQIQLNQTALTLINRRAEEIRRGRGAPAAPGEADAIEAKKECIERRIRELRRAARRATGGTRFHSAAVREHQECVGTTYHVSETVVEEGEEVVELETEVAVEETALTEDDEGIPECRERDGSAITYISVPPGEKLPTLEGTPRDEPEQPSTTVVEDEPEPSDVPDEELDLGLVKAVTSVVTIALSREGSGEPIEGATVKLLEEEPELPVAGLRDQDLVAAEEYLKDQIASTTDGGGGLQVEVAPEIEIALIDEGTPEEQPETIRDVGDADADANGEIRVHHRLTAKAPAAQTVTAIATTAATAMGRMPYPTALGTEWRERICMRRSFVVGDTSLYVLRMPEEVVSRFKEIVSQTESVIFVEDDPCREKEAEADSVRDLSVLPNLSGVANSIAMQ